MRKNLSKVRAKPERCLKLLNEIYSTIEMSDMGKIETQGSTLARYVSVLVKFFFFFYEFS